jgi:hypothetical protein
VYNALCAACVKHRFFQLYVVLGTNCGHKVHSKNVDIPYAAQPLEVRADNSSACEMPFSVWHAFARAAATSWVKAIFWTYAGIDGAIQRQVRPAFSNHDQGCLSVKAWWIYDTPPSMRTGPHSLQIAAVTLLNVFHIIETDHSLTFCRVDEFSISLRDWTVPDQTNYMASRCCISRLQVGL